MAHPAEVMKAVADLQSGAAQGYVKIVTAPGDASARPSAGQTVSC